MPVYKKDEKDHVENYRPISLLCIISKVLERCVLNCIDDRLEDLIVDCQHGFRSGRSCVTNLLETLDYIGATLDRAGQVDCVYLDMSKAFDKVRPTSLWKNCGMLVSEGTCSHGFARISVAGAVSLY